MSSSLPVPSIFGTKEKPLFGVLHLPPLAGASLGVVLCNPLGYEAMCVHRSYRHLAASLAARGIPALRFDYHGTGDSSGDPAQPGRVRGWLESIDEAVQHLVAQTGVRRVGLFGVRFGATLAAEAAAARRDVLGVALCAPSPSGREYVRELRALRLVKESAPGAGARGPVGDDAVAGYVFDRSTLSDLAAIDLLATKEPFAPSLLVIGRDDLPRAEERLARHLESIGGRVLRSKAPGYAAMMRDPQETEVPASLIDEVVTWFGTLRSAGRSVPAHAEPIRSVMTLGVQGTTVREELVRFGEGGRLFGVLAEPPSISPARSKTALLCLNVGANHHVGPNRMYVSAARELAALGHTVLRFDVAGLGESDTPPGGRERRLYSKDSVADVKDAMAALSAARGFERFVLLGLCSGAYLAFHTAVEDRRVVGQVLINPQTFEWKEGDSLLLSQRRSFLGTRYYARSVLRHEVWLRALRGEVDVRGIAGALRERLRDRATVGLEALLARLQGRKTPQSEIERAFAGLSDRGVETLLVFSSNDGGLDTVEKHLGHNARRMRGRRNFALEIVDGADHTFTPLDAQQRLNGILTTYMTTRFASTEAAA